MKDSVKLRKRVNSRHPHHSGHLTEIEVNRVSDQLAGDLSKVCVQISPSHWSGDLTANQRAVLWARILDELGDAEAMMYWEDHQTETGRSILFAGGRRTVITTEGLNLMGRKIGKLDGHQAKLSPNHAIRKQQRRKQIKRSRLPIDSTEVCVYDFETTGLNPSNAEIAQIGAVKWNETGQLEFFNCYVKIKNDIEAEASRVNRLTKEFLTQNGDSLVVALKEFRQFIGERTLVGYNNLQFDQRFLEYSLKAVGQDRFENPQVDLRIELQHLLGPKWSGRESLQEALKLCEIKFVNQRGLDRFHSAIGDAKATAKLVEWIWDKKVKQEENKRKN